MKRRLACFGSAFVLAELIAVYLPSLALMLTAAFLLCVLFVCVANKKLRRLPYVLLIFGAAMGLCWSFGKQQKTLQLQQSLAGQTAACVATAGADCEASYLDGMLRGTLYIKQLDGKKVDIQAYCMAFPGAEAGAEFTAALTFDYPEDDAYKLSRYAKGTYLTAVYASDYRQIGYSTDLTYKMLQVRQGLSQKLRRYLPRDLGAIEAAMLLGDKRNLPDAVQENFRTAGVAHLLSVSGLHVTLLCGLFSLGLFTGRKRNFSKPLMLLQALVLIGYMLLTGMPVSVVRAGMIFMVALLGYSFLQAPDLLNSLGFAAVILGVQNAYLPCDIGFQLSFCGVIGVQIAVAVGDWERRNIPFFRTNVDVDENNEHPNIRKRTTAKMSEWTVRIIETAQCAFFASVFTLPVLLAHRLTASGVAVLTNLLVVWMLQFALIFGMVQLLLSVYAPFAHAFSLVLGLWLKAMYAVICFCATLPAAHIFLQRSYTILVCICLAILAVVFYYNKKMLWYWPVGAVCTATAVLLGIFLQKDVVCVALVGSAGNPCIVITQNDKASVLYRGGAKNSEYVKEYLNVRGIAQIQSLIDLRQNPTENILDAENVLVMEELGKSQDSIALPDTITADLFHSGKGNLVVLDVADYHIAAVTGTLPAATDVCVDAFCAAGSYPTGLSASQVLYTAKEPKWMDRVEDGTSIYYGEEPKLMIRPGKSCIVEEATKNVIQ